MNPCRSEHSCSYIPEYCLS